jgi:riboflavin synthase
MFTGLIESLGQILARRPLPGGIALIIEHDFSHTPAKGASLAVNGVCLTVTEARLNSFTAECYYETINKTTLSSLTTGTQVNLEQALRANSRLDGHLVQGHITAVIKVLRVISRGKGKEITLSLPSSGSEGLLPEGSVALDGVSLTIANLSPHSFSIQLIGETLNRTTLKDRRPGDRINMETDVLLRSRGEEAIIQRKTITMSQLTQWGF